MSAKAVIVGAGRKIGESWTWMASIGMLALLLLIGTSSTFFGVFAVGLALLIVIILCLDLEQAGTLFVTLAMFSAPLNNLRPISSSFVTVSDLIFLLAFAVLTPTMFSKKLALPWMFILGLGTIIVTGVIATVASPITAVSANQMIRLLIGAFSLPILFMIWRPAHAIIVRLAAAYILGTVFSVMYGVAQGPIGGGHRYIGYTYHPNFLGLSCLLAAALVPYVAGAVNANRSWIFWGAGVICALGVYLSGSRAALLVLIMLILIYPFVEGSVKAGSAVFAGILAVVAFSGSLLNSDGNNAVGRLLGGGSASDSDTQREQLASDALKSLKAHPILGNGFDGGLGAHDIYLQVAVAVGIFGLLGFLLVLWAAFRPLFWKGPEHRLAYPVLAYAAIGPLTNTLWERLIWSVMALAFTVVVHGPQADHPEDELGALRAKKGITV
jgi:hypothetical protein